MALIERRQPTHRLIVEVPVAMSSNDLDVEAIRKCLTVCLAVTQLATNDVVCDDVLVRTEKVV